MTYLTGSNTNQAETANNLRGDFNATVEGIRADKNLSPEGKAGAIQHHYERLSGQLKTLEAEEKQARASKVESLRKSLFGLSGYTDAQTVINYRDAEDRVASLSSEEDALRRLERAHLGNDDILTQALVQRAIEAGWGTVLEAWSARNPYKSKQLNELRDSQIDENDIGYLMNNAMTYSVSAPPEIARRNGF